jgi:hypothetical protein
VRKWNQIRAELFARGKLFSRKSEDNLEIISNKRAEKETIKLRRYADKQRENGTKAHENKVLADATATPNAPPKADAKHVPPPDNAREIEDKERKEEEGARAREADFLISVRAALGMDPSDYPPYWTGPTAEVHVERWKGFGLSEADIIAEAKASRAKNPEPPDGPKGLDRWMERAAKAKAAATAPTPEGLTGKAAAAPPKAPSTPEERLAWYAGKINGAGYFAPNGASPQLCRALLDAGLVTPEKLRERGLVA